MAFKTLAKTGCMFLAATADASNFVVASAVTGFNTPENFGIIDQKVYTYYAQDSTGTQWEMGSGIYTVSTHTLSRTTIIGNSDGTLIPLVFLNIPSVYVFGSSEITLEPLPAYLPLVDAATIVVNVDIGFNFAVTLTTSRILGFPTSANLAARQGQSGYIDIKQPGGGGCGLTCASGYTFDRGVAPTMDIVANRVTSLYYHIRSATEVRLGAAFTGPR